MGDDVREGFVEKRHPQGWLLLHPEQKGKKFMSMITLFLKLREEDLAWKKFLSLRHISWMPTGTLKLNTVCSLPSCTSKLVHPSLCQGQGILRWVLQILTVLSRKDLKVKNTIPCHQCREWEMLKVEKLRFHLRVFGNVKKLWNLLPSCCCDDRMVNTWCFLQQEDGQMVPGVPLVRLWCPDSCVSYR